MNKSEKKNNIMLIGFMGAGKSAVAQGMNRLYGMEVAEMDSLIEEKEGMTVNDIFAARGEGYFRDCETALLRELAGRSGLVVSCGGGAVLRPENVALMKESGLVVLLTARPETIYQRVKDSRDRPILNGNMSPAYISQLIEKRREPYSRAADITIETDGKTIEQVCRELGEKAGCSEMTRQEVFPI